MCADAIDSLNGSRVEAYAMGDIRLTVNYFLGAALFNHESSFSLLFSLISPSLPSQNYTSMCRASSKNPH
jgi:hypothetical protein